MVGEYMLVYVCKVFVMLKDVEDVVVCLQWLEVGMFIIGMVSIVKYFLLWLLVEFQCEYEGVEIWFVVGNWEQLVKMLYGNEVDIVIMGCLFKELVMWVEFFVVYFYVFVVFIDYLLFKVGYFIVDSLWFYGFILCECGLGICVVMENFLEKLCMELCVVMEMGSNEIIKQVVMVGMGISFFLLYIIGLEFEYGFIVMFDVEGMFIVCVWNVVYMFFKLFLFVVEVFCYFMLECVEGYLVEKYGCLLMLLQVV